MFITYYCYTDEHVIISIVCMCLYAQVGTQPSVPMPYPTQPGFQPSYDGPMAQPPGYYNPASMAVPVVSYPNQYSVSQLYAPPSPAGIQMNT